MECRENKEESPNGIRQGEGRKWEVLVLALVLGLLRGGAIISLVAVFLSGRYETHVLRESREFIYTNILPSLQANDEVHREFLNLRLGVLYHIARQEPDKKQAAEQRIQEAHAKILEVIQRYDKYYAVDDKERDHLQKQRQALSEYMASIQEPLKYSREDDQIRLWGYLPRTEGVVAKLTEAITSHKQYNQELADAQIKAAEVSDSRARMLSVAILVLAALVVGGISLFVTREIRTRMGRLSQLMSDVAESLDFTKRITITRLDELGTSGDAFNRLLERMQDHLRKLSGHAKSVSEAAAELAMTSQQTASASSHQADSAASMAATVEEMTVSVNHVADRAQETSDLARESGRLAGDGEKVISDTTQEIANIAETVGEASRLIQGLEENSQRISGVVQVIKDVADQTNLLALNAAIEAARAGEQGRGFAVVADEVRKLAERTAMSTREISETIQAMHASASNAVASMAGVVAQVGVGVDKAHQANASIRQIGDGSRGSVLMVGEIAGAIREQGTATTSIAQQVERIAQMAEESSAAAANSADAARTLDRLATEMQQIVGQYRV